MNNCCRFFLMFVWCAGLFFKQTAASAQRPDSRVPGTSRLYPPDPDRYSFEHRHFSESRLNELKNRKEFQYDEKQVQEAIRKEQEKENNRNAKGKMSRDKSDSPPENDRGRELNAIGSVANWIWILIIFAAAVILLMVFLGFKPASFFRRNTKDLASEPAENPEEDINRIPLETELEKAIRLKNFKQAIRILYLGVLKQLNNRQWIDWKQHKTNWDYVREMKNSSLRPGFRNITHTFDYVWYGNFEIDEATFQLIRDRFRLFSKTIETS